MAILILTLGLGIRTWGTVEEGWRHQTVARWRLLRLESRMTARNGNPGYAERFSLSEPAKDLPVFVDVAALVGVQDLVPGWGLSWTDFDLDGDPDLQIANHMHFPSALYVNEGGLFLRRSELPLGTEIGLDDHVGVWGDFNGDGRPDLATANGFYRPDRLFLGLAATGFRQITESAGMAHGERGRGRSAVWADLDGDSWSDLVVFNLMSPDAVYRNNGDGTFADRSEDSGLRNSLAKEGGLVADFDSDGDLDVYVTLMRSRQRNLLYLNRGDGILIEASAHSGANLLGASYSAAGGDYDNDGDLDLYVARAEDQGDVLLRNRGDGTFEDVTTLAGITVSGIGVRNAGFADLDNDGDLDLYTTRGGLLDGPNQRNVLLWNLGDGTFREGTRHARAAGPETGNSASLAFADFNKDGFLDIATTNGAGATAISGPHVLLENRRVRNLDRSRWLKVLPRRTTGSRAGQGATVDAVTGRGGIQRRISGLIRTMAQDAPGTHFGLGAASEVQEIRVEWPDGKWERMQSIPANTTLEITAGERPHALQSHPAALLGDLPPVDLLGVQNRLAPVCPAAVQNRLAPLRPKAEDFRGRSDAVLAMALMRDLDAALEVSEEDLERAWLDLGERTRLPPRVWVEQVAVGSFTTSAVPQPIPLALTRAVTDQFGTEQDVLELARTSGIRAWDHVFALGSVSEPFYGKVEGTVRGYVEQGWLTPSSAWQRFGPFATTLLTAPSGSVIGPIDLREGRDVQPIDRVWPLRRSFRVVRREGPVHLQRSVFAENLARSVRAGQLRQAVSEVANNSLSTAPEAGPHAMVSGVRFSVPRLADAARRIGLEARQDVKAALEVAKAEAALDRLIVHWVSDLDIPEADLLRRVEVNRERWTVPERLKGGLFFFANAKTAEVVRSRLEAGEEPREVADSMGIPALDSRRSRANTAYFDPVTLDRAVAECIFGVANLAEVFSLAAGETSPVLSVGQELYLLKVVERLPAERPDEVAATEWARKELAREARNQILDYLLGFQGLPASLPSSSICRTTSFGE